MFSANTARQAGVQGAPESTTAPAKTVTHCAPAQMYAVQYGDDDGTKHVTMVVKVGSTWYLAPNGEQWSAQLRPLSKASWLAKQLEGHDAALKSTNVPKEDTVDVLGGK